MIAGAGIDGLTAAIEQRRGGLGNELLARAPEIQPMEAGITLAAEASWAFGASTSRTGSLVSA